MQNKGTLCLQQMKSESIYGSILIKATTWPRQLSFHLRITFLPLLFVGTAHLSISKLCMKVSVDTAESYSTKYQSKMVVPTFQYQTLFLAIALLFHHCHTANSATPSSSGSTGTDQSALLTFKSALSDPHGAMRSWKNGSPDLCNWKGVTCGPQPAGRVTALELESLQLEGPLSPSISNITYLRKLLLSDNHFHGSIPQDLGKLARLEQLDLTRNSFEGGIPPTLSACSNLQEIILGGNSLSGEIPSGFTSLPMLDTLILGNNRLTGVIPPLLGNIRPLTYVNLSSNYLSGAIPQHLVNNSVLVFLDLSRNQLTGGIPASVGTCSNLTYLDLSYNNLVGSIPPTLGTGINLITIDLSSNNLSQSIPLSLINSSTLYYLSLTKNGLTGEIPPFMNSLSRLAFLDLSENQLSGVIPQSMGNLSSLNYLYLDQNKLEGSIPESLGSITGLIELYIPTNKLSGKFPSSFYNLTSITYISMSQNNLSGMLLPTMGMHLPMLQLLDLQENKFEGYIPPSLCNASRLQRLDLAANGFSGTIPSCLGNIQNMSEIDLGWNHLQSNDMSFLSSLTNCTILKILNLQQNKLQGELGAYISNFSMKLEYLWLGSNQISGRIPAEISNLGGLIVIFMNQNLFTGSIPFTMGNLLNLNLLDLSGNKLTGEIPSSFGNLIQLNSLYLQDNVLSGSIPSILGMNWKYLAELNLSNNAFDGSIPKQVASLSSLTTYLDLSHNSLSGILPSEIGSLTNLMALNVSYNQLSGEIPSALGSCLVLQHLKMEMNFFQGRIPKAFSNLNAMVELDLSHNNLSGEVPEFMEGWSYLRLLNLSFNNLDGEVPKYGIFSNASAVSVTGNPNLCGGNSSLHLQSCSGGGSRSNKLKIILPIASVAVMLILLCIFCIVYRSKNSSAKPLAYPTLESPVTYSDIFNATNGFSNANLIGSGSFGYVYKGKMLQGESDVAVKVINLHRQGAMKSFITECQALRYIRHRNLLKIVTLCSSQDYSGNEFKALVFAYIPNGSLERWLHPKTEDGLKILSLNERLNIAIDVASALEYLHHNCVPPIVHCDLKPSNILLDNNMTAVVCDFGLARIMSSSFSDASFDSTSLMGLQGSFGYVAPEYGLGSQISWQGDVYSFGVLLLEILTGRSPTDDSFVDGLNLHKYVENAFPEMIAAILDPQILQEVEHEANIDRRFGARMNECLVSLFQIGLICSRESPRERMEMAVVVKDLDSLREVFF